MPAYNANVATGTPLTCCYPLDPPVKVVAAEKPAATTKHQQVVLGNPMGSSEPHECFFTTQPAGSNPSAFAGKIQHASIDADGQYTDLANATTAVAGADNVQFTTTLPFVRFVTTTQPDQPMNVFIGVKA